MAHNIITNSDRRPGDGLLVVGGLPIEGDAILTVKATQGGLTGEVTVLFHQGYNGPHQSAVVLHPWNTDGQRALAITGEDLYAFRELLNELPEEAFVRPKDPVEEFFTIKDDDGDWWAWNAERGRWVVATIGHSTFDIGETAGGIPTSGPNDWGAIKVSDDRAVEEPRWTDGDIVKPDVNSTVTYIRRDGEWFRVSRGAVRTDDLHSDEKVSGLVDWHDYLVVLQQNA